MPLPTLAGISYRHAVKYFSKGFDGGGPYYSVQYFIDNWSDADAFANALIGIGQNSPHVTPIAPGFIASPPVLVEGVGREIINGNGLPDFAGGARITLTYRTNAQFGVIDPSAPPGQPEQIFDPSAPPVLWATEDVDWSTETGTIPNASFKWEADGAVAKVPLKYEVSLINMVLNFSRVRAIPMDLIYDCLDKVNGPGDAITTPGLILPANPEGTFLGSSRGTILLRGPKSTRGFSTDGSVERKLQLVFTRRGKPWGQYLRGGSTSITAGWDYLVDDKGDRQFEEADFRPLLYYAQMVAP